MKNNLESFSPEELLKLASLASSNATDVSMITSAAVTV